MKRYRALLTGSVEPRQVSVPPGKKALVIAPHPDDEVIGVGGALAKHFRAGGDATIVYVTDGADGIPGSDPDTIRPARRREAAAGMAGIGRARQVFLHLEDGSVTADELAPLLLALLSGQEPDIVYCPFEFDNHPDHRASSAALKLALPGFSTGAAPVVLAYEVWTPFVPNYLVDISDVVEIKRSAIASHVSQVEHVRYDEAIIALNRYRGLTAPKPVEYAEAFIMSSAGQFLNTAGG